MGKGDTKTLARRNRAKLAKAAGLPTLAPTKSSRKRRDDNGKFTGPQEDARLTALNARCRHNAMAETDDNRRTVSHPAYESHATQVIVASVSDEVARHHLLTHWERIDAGHEAYYRHVLGKPRFPNVAKMEYLPEPVEARPDDKPDHRTPEEKVRDAKRANKDLDAALAKLTGYEQCLILNALHRNTQLVKDGKPTTSGLAFVAALRTTRGIMER